MRLIPPPVRWPCETWRRADLPIFFEHQRDPVASRMVAFSPRNREAFMAHWADKILGDAGVVKKTILCGDHVAGNIVCFRQAGHHLVGYWLARESWGKGIATQALTVFLVEVGVRPLHAFVAQHNIGSIRVLEKCGFVLHGEHRSLATDVCEAVEELVFVLA